MVHLVRTNRSYLNPRQPPPRHPVSYQPPTNRRILVFPVWIFIIGEDSFVFTSRQFGIHSCLQCVFHRLVHGPFLEIIMLFPTVVMTPLSLLQIEDKSQFTIWNMSIVHTGEVRPVMTSVNKTCGQYVWERFREHVLLLILSHTDGQQPVSQHMRFLERFWSFYHARCVIGSHVSPILLYSLQRTL